ncbi:MAG TPA: cyclic nucleotide-binding domain-containing protein [Myxococcaceae bacterium]
MELVLTGFGELEGIDLLQKIPLFSRLTYDETARLAPIIQHVDVAGGTVVIEQNALGDALYVIQDGEVRVSRDAEGDPGREEELGRLEMGELFGEMALLDDLLTSARVTALRPTRLLKLPKADFERLLQADAALAVKVYRSFCRTLSDRLRRANQMLAVR